MTLTTEPRVGDDLPAFKVESVSADKIRIMALIFQDPNPIHFELEAVRDRFTVRQWRFRRRRAALRRLR